MSQCYLRNKGQSKGISGTGLQLVHRLRSWLCVLLRSTGSSARSAGVSYRAKPRKDIIRKLRNDAAWFAAKGEHRQILFCFSCDPYQHIDEEYQFTRQAIQICHEAGLNICTLTKGGSRALRDIDLFTPRDAFAVTLTTLDDAESKQWEPRAAMPDDRINSLARFHEAGIPTWVSLEPVLSPDTVFEIIRQTKDVVDEFKVGILNYHPQAKRIDWSRFAYDVRELLESLGCNYYLKHDLRKYLR